MQSKNDTQKLRALLAEHKEKKRVPWAWKNRNGMATITWYHIGGEKGDGETPGRWATTFQKQGKRKRQQQNGDEKVCVKSSSAI